MIRYFNYQDAFVMAVIENDLGTTLFSDDQDVKCGDLIDNPDHYNAIFKAEEITPNEFYRKIKPIMQWTDKDKNAFTIFKKSVAVCSMTLT